MTSDQVKHLDIDVCLSLMTDGTEIDLTLSVGEQVNSILLDERWTWS